MAGDNERTIRVFSPPTDSRGGTDTPRVRSRAPVFDPRSLGRRIPADAATPKRSHALFAGVVILALTLGINFLAMVPPLALLLLLDQGLIEATAGNLVILMFAVTAALTLDAVLSAARRVLLAWRAARNEHARGRRLFAGILAAGRTASCGMGSSRYAESVAAFEQSRQCDECRAAGMLLDLPFALLFLVMIHIIAGWLALVPAALLAVGFALALAGNRRGRRATHGAIESRSRRDSFALETLGRIGSIKSAALEAPMMRRFERLIAGGAAAEARIPQGIFAREVAPTMIMGGCALIVAAAGSPALMAGQLGVGELVACMLLATRVVRPAQDALIVWAAPRETRLARVSIRTGLALPPERAVAAAELPRLQGAIMLEEVTLRSESAAAPLLDRVSLQIPAGAMIGITGAAGSGKTTLLMLLAGQRRPEAGRVLLDGRFDPLDHDEDSLLRQVVYVPDHAPIFAGTLLENITLFAAEPGSSIPAHARDRAYDLAERLGLLPLAGRLPMGFNTRIGPGSAISLPQGIAQRIALARAFFVAPRVLLFDVANAALDPAGDDLVRRLLDQERGTCTMLIVSQRPSLLRLADKVYTLADGHLRSPSPSRHMSMVRQRVSA